MSGQDPNQPVEQAIRDDDDSRYVLRLYVGAKPAARRAIASLREICESELTGRYELEVIDVHRDPTRARRDQIIVVPTLIKEQPLPVRWLVGDLSDRDGVLRGLELKPTEPR